MAAIVLTQIMTMFFILAIGVVCAKSQIITEAMVERLSTLLLQVIGPIVIFVSYQTDYSSALLGKLLLSFALSILAFIVQIALSYLTISKKRADSSVERLSAIYSNCGFFGIPLAWGLFGKTGVFYLTGYLTIFNLFFWTQGIIMVAGSTSRKEMAKNLLSPAIVGVLIGLICFLAQIRLPAVVVNSLEMVGNMNTPLAMLVAGASLAHAKQVSALFQGRLYRTAFIKLLLLPLAVALIFSRIAVDATILMVIIMAVAAPTGVSNTMLAIRFGKNSAYASHIFVSTTLLAIFTIPAVVALAQMMGVGG